MKVTVGFSCESSTIKWNTVILHIHTMEAWEDEHSTQTHNILDYWIEMENGMWTQYCHCSL